MNFKHILLTRVNIGYIERTKSKGIDPAKWLDSRLNIFFKCCFPSIINQTNKNFTWILYFDRRTPKDVLVEVKNRTEEFHFIKLFFMDGGFEKLNEVLKNDVRQLVSPDISHLITSRVDTDDMLQRHYIKEVQSLFKGQSFQAINFSRGLVYDHSTGVVGSTFQRSNAFISLVEVKNSEGFQTVYHRAHRDYLNEPYRLEIKEGAFMWCVTIHGLNVSSGFFGKAFLFKKISLKNEFGYDFQRNSRFSDRLKLLLNYFKRKSKKVVPYLSRRFKISYPD